MDIRGFLRESIPSRFANLSQTEFESLIRYLFEMDGYEILPGVHTGELAHIIRATREEGSAVLLALRHDQDHPVREADIETIHRARNFFTADHAWIVTTSVFSPEARKAAKDLGVELWDWDALYNALCQLFFEGKSHIDYFADHPQYPATAQPTTEFRLKAKWEAATGVTSDWYNLGITVSNMSDQNIYMHFELPVLIDHKRQQCSADHWKDGEFTSGMIYAGASVRTNALFSVARLGDRPPGGRIVLTCHERKEVPVTYHLQARLKGEACFVVTYCYSRQSAEYADMILYRDLVLSKSWWGRGVIRMYYAVSPTLVRWAGRHPWMDTLVRRITHWVIPCLRHRLIPIAKEDLKKRTANDANDPSFPSGHPGR